MKDRNNNILIAIIAVLIVFIMFIAGAFYFVISGKIDVGNVKKITDYIVEPNDNQSNNNQSNNNQASNNQSSTAALPNNTNTQSNPSNNIQPVAMYIANVPNSVYLRSAPAEDSSNIITTMAVGTSVWFIENTTNVFAKVQYNGVEGYVKRDYLLSSYSAPTPQKAENTTISKYMYIANVPNSVYFRSSPNENSDNIMATLNLGTMVGYIEQTNGTFSKIVFNGQYGYVKTKFLSDYDPRPQASNTTVSKYMYIANVPNSVYFRSSPYENSGNIITTINLGTKVGYIERADGTFSKIKYNGQYGYVKTKFLADYYSSSDTYMTVCNVKHSIYLRSAPVEDKNNIICEIPVNSTVKYLDSGNGTFYRISWSGHTGYAKSEYLR